MLLGNTSFAKGPFGSIKIGHWAGGAWTNDSTGAFTHCGAVASYLNGTVLVFGQLADQSWSIGFGNQAFHLTPSETFPIDITWMVRNKYACLEQRLTLTGSTLQFPAARL
jgi:hypothetical protein